MIDIETTGLRPGCTVLSIGACLFEPTRPGSRMHFEPDNHLLVYISSFDSLNQGLRVEAPTQRWWGKMEFGREVHEHASRSEVTVTQACEQLSAFLLEHKPACVWANSPRFDIEILWTLFERAGKQPPIYHRIERDFRTIMDTVFLNRDDRPARPPEIAEYPAHHPLGDAILQADQLRQAFARVRIDNKPIAEHLAEHKRQKSPMPRP